MGIIEDTKTNEQFELSARTLLGRSPVCDLVVSHGGVSKEHAVIWWEDDRWWVRDLGSRNGTFIEQVRLEAGERRALRPGLTMEFGGQEVVWTVRSLAPPTDESLGLGRTIDDKNAALRVPDVTLRFQVSLDEEHVVVQVSNSYQTIDLQARSHLYVLLVLARAWREDAALPEPERGWIDRQELCRMVAMKRNVLNMMLHRCRKQMAAEGVLDTETLIERRSTALRVHCAGVEIGPLET